MVATFAAEALSKLPPQKPMRKEHSVSHLLHRSLSGHRVCCILFRGHSGHTRMKQEPSRLLGYLLNLYSAIIVFLAHLIKWDTGCAICISVLGVVLCDRYGVHVAMNFNYGLVSFGIVFPITMSISQAYTRREKALTALLSFRGYATALYTGHAAWQWAAPGDIVGGRKSLPTGHVDSVRTLMSSMYSSFEAYMLMPRGGHARHYYTHCGLRESRELVRAQAQHGWRLERALTRLVLATERLKAHGFPSGEASRLHQYAQKLQVEWQLVRSVKEYQTPHAMRSFARVYILLLGGILSPYFVYLVHQQNDAWPGGNSHATRLVFATLFCATVAVMMAGLFSVSLELENPFRPTSIDAVRVRHEMKMARLALHKIDREVAKGGELWDAPLESDVEHDEDEDEVEENSLPAAATAPFVV